MSSITWVSAAGAICLLLWAGAGASAAAPPPAATPPVVQALTQCRKLTDAAARLQCYDTASAALETAQTRGDVVVVDREQVRAVRRQAFGLALPSLNLFPHGKDENPNALTLTLARASQAADGRWRMVSQEGAEWMQSEPDPLFAEPHAGSRLDIRRGALNGYFCKVDGQAAFRCRRDS